MAMGKLLDILNALDIDLNHLRRKVEILSPANPNISFGSNEKKNLHLNPASGTCFKDYLFRSQAISEYFDKYSTFLLLCILRNENDPTTKLLNKLKVDYDNVKEQFKLYD